jgi:hypothetical protein
MAASQVATSAVLYLPVDYDPIDLCDAVRAYSDFDQVAEFEVLFYRDKPIALVCYLGACVKFSRKDLSSIVASKLGCRADAKLTQLTELGSVRSIIDSLTITEPELTDRSQLNLEAFLINFSNVPRSSTSKSRLQVNECSSETSLVNSRDL